MMAPEDRAVYIRNDLAKRLYEALQAGFAGIGVPTSTPWPQLPDEIKSVYQHAALVLFNQVEKRVEDEEVKILIASHEELVRLIKERDSYVSTESGAAQHGWVGTRPAQAVGAGDSPHNGG